MSNRVVFTFEAMNMFSAVAKKIKADAGGIRKKMVELKNQLVKTSTQMQKTTSDAKRMGKELALSSQIPAIGPRGASFAGVMDNLTVSNRKSAAAFEMMRARAGKLKRRLGDVSAQMRRTGKDALKMGRSIASAGQELTMKLTLPLAALGTAAIVQSAKLEKIRLSLQSFVGTADKAKTLLNKITSFTARTPFQLEGVTKATTNLLQFGVEEKNIFARLTQLGDMAAATGGRLNEMASAFGKVKAEGKLSGEVWERFVTQGVNLHSLIAEGFGVPISKMKELQRRGQLTFEVVAEAIKRATGEGAKFHKGMERLSQATAGLFSTIKDSTIFALAALGDTIIEVSGLKDIMRSVIKLLDKFTAGFKKWADANPGMAKLVGILALVLMALGPILLVISQLVIGFAAMTIAAAILGTTVAALTLPILAVVAVVGLLATAAIMVVSQWDKMKAGARALARDIKGVFTDMIDNIKSGLTDWIKRLKEDIQGFKRFFGFGDAEITKAVKFSGDANMHQSSSTKIDIGIKAPAGAVELIKSVTTGHVSGLNLGVNMATL